MTSRKEMFERMSDEAKEVIRTMYEDDQSEIDRISIECNQLRARLKWFEDREAVARRVIEYATADWDTDSNVLEYWKARRSLLDWERDHPKPKQENPKP